MGYSTEFQGELKFSEELTAKQLAKLKTFLSEDCRNHPEWENSEDLDYVDLEFNDDFSGLKWNGAEKTCGMVKMINMITTNMQKEYPDFSLTGELLAQGENFEDRWRLVMKDGVAYKEEFPRIGDKIKCPLCEGTFILEK